MKHVLLLVCCLVFPWISQAQEQTATPPVVKLTWEDNSANETGFIIERRIQVGGEMAEIARVGANEITYSDSSVKYGEALCWRVKAFNNAGPSDPSNIVCVTIPVAPSVPAAPGPITIEVIVKVSGAATTQTQGETPHTQGE